MRGSPSHQERVFGRWVRPLLGDVRFALRGFWRRPSFPGVLVALALGVGANSATVTLAAELLVTAPDYVRNPQRVVLVPSIGSYVEYRNVSRDAKTLEPSRGHAERSDARRRPGGGRAPRRMRYVGVLRRLSCTPSVGSGVRGVRRDASRRGAGRAVPRLVGASFRWRPGGGRPHRRPRQSRSHRCRRRAAGFQGNRVGRDRRLDPACRLAGVVLVHGNEPARGRGQLLAADDRTRPGRLRSRRCGGRDRFAGVGHGSGRWTVGCRMAGSQPGAGLRFLARPVARWAGDALAGGCRRSDSACCVPEHHGPAVDPGSRPRPGVCGADAARRDADAGLLAVSAGAPGRDGGGRRRRGGRRHRSRPTAGRTASDRRRGRGCGRTVPSERRDPGASGGRVERPRPGGLGLSRGAAVPPAWRGARGAIRRRASQRVRDRGSSRWRWCS